MTKERFSKLKFKIFGAKQPVIILYPELLRYKPIAEAQAVDDFDAILRYIILLYDPNTDLNQECPDLKDRRVEAQAISGLKPEHFEAFINLEKVYVDLIQCFLCEIYHNRKNREWHTAQQELDDFTRMRWDANMKPEQRLKLGQACDEIHKKLDVLEPEIFGDHDDIKEVIIADRWSSPEKFAAPTIKTMVNA